MKTPFTRRRFLQTAAISSAVTMVPSLAAVKKSTVSDLPEGQLPQRRLGRTNKMVSCLGFGGGSQWCSWPAKDDLLRYAMTLPVSHCITRQMRLNMFEVQE